MKKPGHYKVTGETKQGGGIPTGFEHLERVDVYAKPSSKDSPIKKDPSKKQGVWCESFNAVNPVELWIFEKGEEPVKLLDSGHPVGTWGYKPGTTDPKKCAVEEMWFFPPKAKAPKSFRPMGVWSFPVMKRDENALDPDTAGFLHVGDSSGGEKLDVAGRWRLLYQRPGEPKSPTKPKDMKIYVKKPNGHKIPLNVKPSDTVDDVKNKVTEKSGIPKDDQRLRHRGKPLEDDKPTLKNLGIEDGDIFSLDPMEIFVKDPQGKTYTLAVEPSNTINDVKKMLENQEGIPMEEQRLSFDGSPCNDEKNLRDHGIKHHSTLNLDPMTIFVKDPKKSKTYTLENVDPKDTIAKIKQRLDDDEGIPKRKQRLSFKSKPCVDSKNLRDHGIKHKSTIVLEPMEIYVKTPEGKKLTFDVEPTDTIKDMKRRIERKENVPPEDQRLLFGNNPLIDDSKTLDDEGIQHKDTIEMEPMHIIIKDWNGKKFPISCIPDETIDSIKDKIEAKEGHPKPVQFLIRGGNFLEDPKALRDYGIKHKDVVNLDRMKIYVTDWKGKTFTLEVDPDENIEDVKKMIEAREGVPVANQILKFKDQKLDNPQNLDDYGIRYKDTVDLSKEMPEAPKTPPKTKTYTIQLSPYKSPLEEGYSPGKLKKREGIRAKTKEAFKDRWHTDLATETAELGRMAEERHNKSQSHLTP